MRDGKTRLVKTRKQLRESKKIGGQSCGEQVKAAEMDSLSGRWSKNKGTKAGRNPRRLKRKIFLFCALRLNCKADRELPRILRIKETRSLRKLA